MSGTEQDAETAPSDTPVPTEDAHTEGGAPKDEAHQDAGNGTLTAALSMDGLPQRSEFR